MKHSLAAILTSLCSIAAGLLHLSVVAVAHWTPFPPLEGMFFIVGGAIQVFLGIRFLRIPTLNTYRLGLSMNGGMAILCIMMQYLPVPFVGETETLGTLAAFVVAFELIAVAASLRWLHTHEDYSERKKIFITVPAAIAVMFLWGAGYYGGGQVVATLMPERSVAHDHGHGKGGHLPPDIVTTGDSQENEPHGDDNHHDDEHHDHHDH